MSLSPLNGSWSSTATFRSWVLIWITQLNPYSRKVVCLLLWMAPKLYHKFKLEGTLGRSPRPASLRSTRSWRPQRMVFHSLFQQLVLLFNYTRSKKYVLPIGNSPVLISLILLLRSSGKSSVFSVAFRTWGKIAMRSHKAFPFLNWTSPSPSPFPCLSCALSPWLSSWSFAELGSSLLASFLYWRAQKLYAVV